MKLRVFCTVAFFAVEMYFSQLVWNMILMYSPVVQMVEDIDWQLMLWKLLHLLSTLIFSDVYLLNNFAVKMNLFYALKFWIKSSDLD
jgi:hypothetical protein